MEGNVTSIFITEFIIGHIHIVQGICKTVVGIQHRHGQVVFWNSHKRLKAGQRALNRAKEFMGFTEGLSF